MMDWHRPLEFSLSSKGVIVTGGTNSGTELLEFIERLNSLVPVLDALIPPPMNQGGE